MLGPEGDGSDNIGIGLHITLLLDEKDLPKRDERPAEARKQRELEDHRERERDIENIEVLRSAPKDKL